MNFGCNSVIKRIPPVKAQTKATVFTVTALLSMVAVPVLLVVLRDWLAVITIAVIYPVIIWLFVVNMYKEIRHVILLPLLADEQAIQSLGGDPLKIHFYRGYKKYFDGDLDADGLQLWLQNHRPN